MDLLGKNCPLMDAKGCFGKVSEVNGLWRVSDSGEPKGFTGIRLRVPICSVAKSMYFSTWPGLFMSSSVR